MSSGFLVALIVQCAAALWSLTLIRRAHDRRYALVLVLLLAVAATRLIDHVGHGLLGSAPDHPEMHWPNLASVSIMAAVSLALVWQLRGALTQREQETQAARLLAGALEKCRASVMVTDAQPDLPGPRIVMVNRALCAMTGYTREELLGATPRILQGPTTDRATLDRLRRAIESGSGFLGEADNYRKDGSVYRLSWSVSPVRDARGVVTHFLSVQHDVSAFRETERAMNAATAHLKFHMENAPLAIIEFDPQFRITGWSGGAERMLGWSAQEAMGRTPLELGLIDERDRAMAERQMAEVLSGTQTRTTGAIRDVTKDGRVIDVEWCASVHRDESGRVQSLFTTSSDVSERMRAQQRQRLLMRELDHRVRNNLSVIESLAEQTAGASASIEEFRAAFGGRLRALAQAHTLLARSEWHGVDLASLAQGVLGPFADRFEHRGPPVTLDPSQATVLALVLQELATNAAKYGGLRSGEGRVGLTWERLGGNGSQILELKWTERSGRPIEPPECAGFGTRFIQSVVTYELQGDASLVFDPRGLECHMRVPLGRAASSRLEHAVLGGAS